MSHRSSADDGLSFDDVVDLLRLLDGSDLPTKIDYRDGPLRLKIERGGTRQAATQVAEAAPAADTAAVPTGPAPAADAQPTAVTEPPVDEDTVRAPIAGVFYRAPAPDAAPFVEVGQSVDEDTAIGIIEVMKLMNTIRSGRRGVVTEICVADAELVEFDQVILRVRAEA